MGGRTTAGDRPEGEERARTKALTAKERKRFLDLLAATCNVTTACATLGVSTVTLYNWRRKDAGFAARWQEALTTGYQRLEEALLSRALVLVEDRAAAGEAIEPEVGDALLREAAGAAAPAGEDAAARAIRSAAGKLTGEVSVAEMRFVLELIEKSKATLREPRRGGRARRATAQEVDAAINRKLDAMARRLGLPL